MKRKWMTAAVVAGALALAVYGVVRGGKRTHRYQPRGGAMTLVVEMPKTNAGGSATATGAEPAR